MRKDKEFLRIYAQYQEKYEVEKIQNPNDVANLETMIRNQLLIEKLQDRLDGIADDPKIDPMEVKKVLDSITALSATNMQYEKTLGIDRKTRKTEQAESFPDYLAELKKMGREFIDNEQRLTRIYCPTCQIMVGRISGVYDTTEFNASFQCPQCKKHATITRKEKDIFFDVKDANWRKKYPMEVIQAKRVKAAPDITMSDDVILDDDEGYE
ncbi:MAG TPA: hypothetical protein VL854_01780 [Nitrososphaeraceae archaeon]|jgi:hypothetical protein|nr:hypothetical protein [Nitrososphaeraceae archaeon]